MSFPRYESYKDSGVEWLGEVPEHWIVAELKRRFQIIGGSTPKSDQESFWGGEIIWVIPADLSKLSSLYISDSQRKISSEGLASCGTTLVPKNSIILSTRAPIGSLAIAETNLCTNQGCKALVPFGATVAKFFGYLLSISAEELNIRGKGTTFLELSGDELSAFKVPVPSISEQQTIAAFLDRETTKIDALIAEQQRLIELLKEKRQAVISHAVTKGLAPPSPCGRGAGGEGVRMKDSGIEWLGEVPAHWEVKRLRFLADVQSGVAKGKDNSGQETIEVPYLRVANVQDGFLDLETVTTIEIPASSLERYLLRVGDVLMNEGGDYDKLGRGHIWNSEIEPCIHQNHVFAIRPSGLSSEWLNEITGSSYAQFYFMTRSKQSTNLASISSTNIMELPVVLPPIIEQQQILMFLSDQRTRFDTLTTEAQRAIDLLKERRSALISAAVTGKIDVRGLVDSLPNASPA